jgi:N6-adenosine-specific RNA methylase IME4
MTEGAHPLDVRGETVTARFDGDPTSWPFGALRPFSYDLAMVDPPWPTEMRSAKGEGKSHARHYGAMTFEQIYALPVGQLLAPASVVILWCTWPLILHGGDPKRHFANPDASYSPQGRCLKEWGVRYVTGGAWFKRTKHGKPAFGPGYRARSSCEPFIIGISGNPVNSRSARNAIEGLARQHSQKPEEAYRWCEDYMPGARRVELFSRTSRPGWDSWGFEAGKFDPVVSLGNR